MRAATAAASVNGAFNHGAGLNAAGIHLARTEQEWKRRDGRNNGRFQHDIPRWLCGYYVLIFKLFQC